MAGKSNLRVLSSEEARENGRKGGLASVKARKAAKVYADAAKVLFASKFKTEYAGEDLRELCMGFGLGETETGAIMMALSDFMRVLREGNSESAERLLSAVGGGQSAPQSADAFEPSQIYVMPSAKPGEEIVIEEGADTDADT